MPIGHLYSCYDFRLLSEVPLDELMPALPDDIRPVVTIRLGRVSQSLADGVSAGPLQVSAGKAFSPSVKSRDS